jgi:ribonuclease D
LIFADLSSEYIDSLPVISFVGEIKIIADTQEFCRLLDALSAMEAVGIDTESKPSFRKGVQYPISVLQLATETEAYIVRLRATGFPSRLKKFFESETKKIGLGLNDDLRKLRKLREFTPNAFIDISSIASGLGHTKTSLRTLTARYLERRVIKSSKTDNWSKPTLTEKELRYAATDAWLPLLLIKHLKQSA